MMSAVQEDLNVSAQIKLIVIHHVLLMIMGDVVKVKSAPYNI